MVWLRSPLATSEDACRLADRPHQAIDERVDRGDLFGPPAAGAVAERGALADFTLPADGPAHTLQFLGDALVLGGDIVEGIGDLAINAGPVDWQTHRKIAVLDGDQGVQHAASVECAHVQQLSCNAHFPPPFFTVRMRVTGPSHVQQSNVQPSLF